MDHVSRRALLARAGAGTGAGVIGLLAGGVAPALAGSETDLANTRLICSCKRLMINWYTRWLNTPKALGESPNMDLLLAIRKQERAHYALLAPLLGATAPSDDDFTFTLPGGALRSLATASKFAVDLETMMLGIGIGAAATTENTGVAASIARVVGGDGQHLAAVSVLAASWPVPTALPRPIGVEDASIQLSQFLSN
jgi:Ferritin-like domain